MIASVALKRGAHDARGRLVDTAKRRRVAAVEQPLRRSRERSRTNSTYAALWNAQQLLAAGRARLEQLRRARRGRAASNSRTKAAWRSGPNGMAVAEAVAGQLLTHHHGRFGRRQCRIRRELPAAYASTRRPARLASALRRLSPIMRGPSSADPSDAATMAQYIYTMNRVSKVVPPEADDPARHQPVVLPRRQDRRAGPQRLGQIHAAAHHGRHRPRAFDGEARAADAASASASCRRSRSSIRPRTCAAPSWKASARPSSSLERFNADQREVRRADGGRAR